MLFGGAVAAVAAPVIAKPRPDVNAILGAAVDRQMWKEYDSRRCFERPMFFSKEFNLENATNLSMSLCPDFEMRGLSVIYKPKTLCSQLAELFEEASFEMRLDNKLLFHGWLWMITNQTTSILPVDPGLIVDRELNFSMLNRSENWKPPRIEGAIVVQGVQRVFAES